MRKWFIFLLTFLLVYIILSLYFLDKVYFLCPIEYKREILIRCDLRGNGFFAADRGGNKIHEGIDLLVQIGTPVLASRSGRVIVSRIIANKGQRIGSGNYVVLLHPGNITTVYGHLLEVCVKKNDLVRQGQMIGRVGKTGNANYPDIQPHLHFEVRKNGIPQDPLEYLQKDTIVMSNVKIQMSK
jgi:murein DD-endopeptidase MepM/ murein hydrolase activator NlpD